MARALPATARAISSASRPCLLGLVPFLPCQGLSRLWTPRGPGPENNTSLAGPLTPYLPPAVSHYYCGAWRFFCFRVFLYVSLDPATLYATLCRWHESFTVESVSTSEVSTVTLCSLPLSSHGKTWHVTIPSLSPNRPQNVPAAFIVWTMPRLCIKW